MSRHQFIHAAALCAAILVLLLGVVGCVPRAVRVDQTTAEVPQAANAMAAMEPPDYATAEPPPPPPPPPPPATQTCPDGSVVLATDACPIPPSPPPPHPMYSAGYAMGTGEAAPTQHAGRGETAAIKIDNEPFAGLGAFVKPPAWIVDKSYTLEFVVGKDEAGLGAVSQNHELTARSNIWMAQTMRVTLDPNPDFAIAPQNPDQEIQQLSPDKTANWFWNVTPHRSGKFTLVARVQAVRLGPDGEPMRDAAGNPMGRFYPAQTVEVQVRVATKTKVIGAIGDAGTYSDALGKMFGSWKKMLGALVGLIGAVAAVIVAIRKLREGSAGEPAKPA